MKLFRLALIAGVMGVVGASGAYADANNPLNKRAPGGGLSGTAATGSNGVVEPANRQTAAAVAVCFTCGGDWPVFMGIVRAGNYGAFSAYERGSSCGGAANWSSDSSPYICSR